MSECDGSSPDYEYATLFYFENATVGRRPVRAAIHRFYRRLEGEELWHPQAQRVQQICATPGPDPLLFLDGLWSAERQTHPRLERVHLLESGRAGCRAGERADVADTFALCDRDDGVFPESRWVGVGRGGSGAVSNRGGRRASQRDPAHGPGLPTRDLSQHGLLDRWGIRASSAVDLGPRDGSLLETDLTPARRPAQISSASAITSTRLGPSWAKAWARASSSSSLSLTTIP